MNENGTPDIYITRWLKAYDLTGDTELTIAGIHTEGIGDEEKRVLTFKETLKNLRLNFIISNYRKTIRQFY
jgi:hypothetical protein